MSTPSHDAAVRAKLEALDRERDELEAVIAMPGWRRFAEEVGRRYSGDRFREAVTALARAVAKSDGAPSIIGQQVQQQMAVYEHVEKVLQWPRERIAAIDAERKALRTLLGLGDDFHRVGR